MLFWEILRLTALGLVIGGLGGLAVPGSRAVIRLSAVAAGVGGALVGGVLGVVLLGGGFHGTRLMLAALVSALLVCGWTLYLRERRLPR
ncbi:hypothetical protein KGA66_11440 [Actinocrinis puniceicyclus]|uniref:GlsB/YeaQ/YmgE family stress response membrane protein n=1 Tax=Actinocrinis puniceicyclus TaxID=977794 RepID=A0A8J7WMV5_9ACTN|nr:hypothetical protein [Actinocrinis puniceicyclus]MBS2963665.1 hypothetical protein [Actinocrinis puniceicyclus]